MKPTQKIDATSWMRAPETQMVMRTLHKGKDMQVLFVGGCVRNTLLKQDVNDIDIATIFEPEEVIARLKAAGIHVIPTGIEHGTVTAVVNKKYFEITTLRRDVETYGRHAVVGYTKSWEDDAQRRDFTINTLLCDEQGHVYDPTGRGLKDLTERRIMFVGDPAQRIAEDYLRVLRFFRFYAYYGGGKPDAAAMKACKEAAPKVLKLSKERITQEFFKLMGADEPSAVVDMMFKNGVLDVLKFEGYQPAFLEHLSRFQERYGLFFLGARLFVLAGLSLENIEKMKSCLLLPKVIQKDIQGIHDVLQLPPLDHDHAVKVAIYRYGRVPTAQALLIELVQDRVMNGYTRKALYIIQNWDVPHFPVSGQDLMNAGVSPGPDMGEMLNSMESKWVESGFDISKQELLQSVSFGSAF